MSRILILAAVAAVIASAWATDATAGFGSFRNRVAQRQAQTYPWHGDYYDAAWGAPVAVLVPPTAETQTHWSWGVGGTRVTPIDHQFHRNYPGPSMGGNYGSRSRATPPWPSSTDQFGDYYIRGPW